MYLVSYEENRNVRKNKLKTSDKDQMNFGSI